MAVNGYGTDLEGVLLFRLGHAPKVADGIDRRVTFHARSRPHWRLQSMQRQEGFRSNQLAESTSHGVEQWPAIRDLRLEYGRDTAEPAS